MAKMRKVVETDNGDSGSGDNDDHDDVGDHINDGDVIPTRGEGLRG